MSLSLLRSILITAPLIVLFTILFASASVAASFFDPTGIRQMRVARAWGKTLCAVCRIRIETEGMAKLSPQAHYVFSPNHLSYMDTPVILASLPADFRFMAKEELFRIPFLGTHLKQAGHIAVPLEDPRGSIKALSQAARIINEKNISVLIFPEGGRSESGELQEFKDGAAFTAIKAGIPIVPVALCGTREILPMHSMNVRGGAVRVCVGEPIVTAGLRSQDRAEVTKQLRAQIVTLLGSTPVVTHA